MTSKEVMQLAYESGMIAGYEGEPSLLERFARLVATAEREACLEIADHCADADMHASMVANAIRARSNP